MRHVRVIESVQSAAFWTAIDATIYICAAANFLVRFSSFVLQCLVNFRCVPCPKRWHFIYVRFTSSCRIKFLTKYAMHVFLTYDDAGETNHLLIKFPFQRWLGIVFILLHASS